MKFIKALTESESSEKYKEKMKKIGYPFDEDIEYRSFNHIRKDDVSLSVQASYGHYCTPRITLENLKEYSSMEFALIREGEFISVRDILPNLDVLEEIEEHFDGSVYGYVPVSLIEKLYQSYFVGNTP